MFFFSLKKKKKKKQRKQTKNFFSVLGDSLEERLSLRGLREECNDELAQLGLGQHEQLA